LDFNFLILFFTDQLIILSGVWHEIGFKFSINSPIFNRKFILEHSYPLSHTVFFDKTGCLSVVANKHFCRDIFHNRYAEFSLMTTSFILNPYNIDLNKSAIDAKLF